jgi:hypothetical protein
MYMRRHPKKIPLPNCILFASPDLGGMNRASKKKKKKKKKKQETPSKED